MARLAVSMTFVALVGCAQFKPPAEGAGGDTRAAKKCNVYGNPYTYADEHGTKVSSDDGLTLNPLRVKAALAQASEVYAGVGLTFKEPKGPFDGSRYEGIVFAAKRSAASTAYLRFKVPDANTDPTAGVCKECYNDFGISFQVSEEWTRYEVRFSDLAQEADWGDPRPEKVDAAKLYGLQWQVAVPGAQLDLAIKDIQFMGCGDKSAAVPTESEHPDAVEVGMVNP